MEIKISDKNFKGKIDKLILEADEIIYKKVFIHYLKIKISNFFLKINYQKKLFFFDKLNSDIFLVFTAINLRNLIFNKQWSNIKLNIENFISNDFKICDITVYNQFINFISFDNQKRSYLLDFKGNKILLKDPNNKKSLEIDLDPNIKLINLYIENKKIFMNFLSNISLKD